jgi:hypothetical protein
MRSRFTVLFAVVLSAALSGAAKGEPAGPFCFSTAPFIDVYEWFLEASGGDNFTITGKSNDGRAMSAFGHLEGDNFILGFNIYPDAEAVPVVGGATINLGTLTGPARCFTPDFESCGDFTIALVSCSARTTISAPAGPAQGRSR